jgi:hypothetical protein
MIKCKCNKNSYSAKKVVVKPILNHFVFVFGLISKNMGHT